MKTSRLALLGGPLLALTLGAVTSSIRDHVGASNLGAARSGDDHEVL